MENRRNIQIFFFVFIAILSLMVMTVPEVSGKPNMEEVANMADAIRYLEQLDKYYSQVARPRYPFTKYYTLFHIPAIILSY